MFDLVLDLLATLVFLAGCALIAYAVAAGLVIVMHKLLGADDLHDVYAREDALTALERIHGDTYGQTITREGYSWPVPATDRCKSCDRPVLVENTWAGVCGDCLVALGDVEASAALDTEWADIMRAIDDERDEHEDHR